MSLSNKKDSTVMSQSKNTLKFFKGTAVRTYEETKPLCSTINPKQTFATVHDEAENEWLKTQQNLNECQCMWIGMNDVDKEGIYVNEDESPVDYLNFEMNDVVQNQYYTNYVAMWEGIGGVSVTKGKWVTKNKQDTCDCQACVVTTSKFDFRFTKTAQFLPGSTTQGEYAWTLAKKMPDGKIRQPVSYHVHEYDIKLDIFGW